MGRQDNDNNSDPTMVNSSIALLQERFRQLEKMKERREGKELLKLLSNSETQQRGNSSPSSNHNNSLQQHPRSVVHQDHSLSLSLNLSSKQGDHHHHHHHYTMKSSSSTSSSSSRNFDSSDVDTSLHL